MAKSKSAGISVRVPPHIKVALQASAESELRNIADMVEVMVVVYCRRNDAPLKEVPEQTLPVVKQQNHATKVCGQWPL